MCVAALAWHADREWPLVAAGNRDEFHQRASAPLARWPGEEPIIAGRDLVGGGTWLGVSENGRFALVTNFRVPEGSQAGRPSRGGLVTDLLAGREPSGIEAMNPFNLVHCDLAQAFYLGNHPVRHEPLAPGIHGLSNGGFDVPWPKTRRVEQALADFIAGGCEAIDGLFAGLRDESPLPSTSGQHAAAPDSGPEPRLSPVFISDETYGTRCSSLVMVDRRGRGTIIERRFSCLGDETGRSIFRFAWQKV